MLHLTKFLLNQTSTDNIVGLKFKLYTKYVGTFQENPIRILKGNSLDQYVGEFSHLHTITHFNKDFDVHFCPLN